MASSRELIPERLWGPLLAGAFAMLAAAPQALLPPVTCPLRRFTGLPCPTCGGTRALMALRRLDLTGALALNPLVTIAALGALLYLAHAAAVLAGRRAPLRLELATPGRRVAFAAALAGAVVANWTYLVLAGR